MKNPFSKILINTAPAPSPIRSKIPSVWPMQRPSNNIFYIKPTFDSRKYEDLEMMGDVIAALMECSPTMKNGMISPTYTFSAYYEGVF